MCLSNLNVKSNVKNYDVLFKDDAEFMKDLASLENALYIIDANVWHLYKDTILKVLPLERVIVQDVHEDKKNIKTVCCLYEKIMDFSLHRNMHLVSFGGGIIQDVTGFVASTIFRGVNWIFVPTTLLSQVDSCIGGKTSLNFKQFKNLVGTFYPPAQVYLYPGFLNTLNREDFYSGIGEMAKLHLIGGEEQALRFIEFLSRIKLRDSGVLLDMIYNSLKIKKGYIESDEFDAGLRNILNFGHCFGHAIESATNFAIPHGQAVVFGMILANKYALKIGMLSKELEGFIREKFLNPIFVVPIPSWSDTEVVEAMKRDKKVTGKGLALVMLTNDYKMTKITDIEESDVLEFLKDVHY